MRSMFLGAAFVTISATAASVGALNISGSDTLELFTDLVLADPACTGVSSLNYVGGGSTKGQNDTVAGLQQVASMSRYLNSTAASCTSYPEGEGIVVALDGLAIVANKGEAEACGNGLAVNKTLPSGYTLGGWRDVLSIIYFGRQKDSTTRDCNSAVRNELANNWGSLFQSGCTGSTCTKLNHAWRRSDFSGTTDVFVTLVSASHPGGGSGLSIPLKSGSGVNPFCNSATTAQAGGVSDFQDNDPIRRDCANDEQVCSMPLYSGSTLARNDKKLGLVQVIFVPELSTNAENYPTQACTFGQCRFLLTGATVLNCPNGKPQLFGKCFGPVRTTGLPAGQFDAACINQPNFTCFGATPGQDGRAYNLAVRKSDGKYAVDKENRPVFGAYFRIHTTQQTISPTGVMTLGTPLCREDDATRQIGCLPQVDKCSIGFAGREAESAELRPDTKALSVDGIFPTLENVESLVTGVGPRYPLARKLYFNTLKGFGAVTGEEANLAACMSNKTIVDRAVNASGFIPLPGAALKCQDNNCGAGTGCENNVAPIPSAE